MPKIIDLLKHDSSVIDQIKYISKCKNLAIAQISTSTTKTVYVTDNGRCFTHGRLANKESLTECHAKNRYGRLVFLFSKSTTTHSLFGAAELIYSSFNRISYEDINRCSFRDMNPFNIHLENLYLEDSISSLGIKSMEKYAQLYSKNHRRLSKSLHYVLNDNVDYESCRDIVSDVFFWLCMKFDSETQRNEVDFVSVWFYWCKKEANKSIKRNDRMSVFDDRYSSKCYQNQTWDVYRLIDQYIHKEEYNQIAKMMASGYTNKDLSEKLGISMHEANYRRSNIMRMLRSKLN